MVLLAGPLLTILSFSNCFQIYNCSCWISGVPETLSAMPGFDPREPAAPYPKIQTSIKQISIHQISKQQTEASLPVLRKASHQEGLSTCSYEVDATTIIYGESKVSVSLRIRRSTLNVAGISSPTPRRGCG